MAENLHERELDDAIDDAIDDVIEKRVLAGLIFELDFHKPTLFIRIQRGMGDLKYAF